MSPIIQTPERKIKPVTQILIKDLGILEESIHGHDGTHIPLIQGLIKVGGTFKHVNHRGDRRNIPRPNGLIELNSVAKTGGPSDAD